MYKLVIYSLPMWWVMCVCQGVPGLAGLMHGMMKTIANAKKKMIKDFTVKVMWKTSLNCTSAVP